ncbi:MAG: LLM class flavin-dependent oxidoreductase [Actinomycetota bacterium]
MSEGPGGHADPMRLRVGISTPWDLMALDVEGQRRRLSSIADVGIDQIFTADHVSFHGGGGTDGLIRLASLGGMEPRLDLYLGVYLLALRHPMVVARQISTFAETAPGRLTVGVGVGGEDRSEIEVCGVDPRTRGRRTDVSLSIVRALLDGETVDGDGEFFRFEGGRIRPSPTPRVPFVVGGRSDQALERAGRYGDGWLAAWVSPRRFAEGVERVESMAADRRPSWQHGLQLWVGVGETVEDGRRHVAKRMADFYKLDFELFARYTPTGTAEEIADFLQPYREAGATTFNLTPCGADPEVEMATIAQVADLLRTAASA